MNYSLGNMLSRGGALNPDGLSLDLAFALDKTLTARKGPTPTFTRASSATFVNTNGIIVGKTVGTTSSITPSTTTIGSQVTVTVASGSVVGWVVGQAISLIVDTDADDQPDTNELWLLGDIVSTTPTTLTFTVTSRTAQAGATTSWTLGYRGARFDHDPVTLACKGLLIEELRMNLLTRSAEFDNLAWTPITLTVTPNQLQSPDGGVNADMVTVTGANQGLYQVATVTPLATYTFSVHVKLDTLAAANFRMAFRDDTNGAFIHVDVAPSQVVTSGSWTRVTYAVIAPASCTQLRCYPFRNTSSVSGTFYLWGAQLEAGSFPTSYIPTTTTALTRSADVCSITGSDFAGMWQSATAATILLEANASAMTASTSGNRGIATLSNGAAYSNQIGFYKESGTNFIRGRTPTVNLIQVSNLLGKFKGAIAIDSSTAGCFNGGTVITGSDNIGTVDRLTFADATLSPAGHPSVCISRYQIYRKRLPDAKLQSLTTP